MARKTFEECKRGDTMYLLDLENNLNVKKVTLREIARWYGQDSYRCDVGLKDHLINGCVKTRSRSENLFTTEEEALAFKASIEKGEKVFYNVKKGDTAYLILDGYNEIKKATFASDFSPTDYIKVSYGSEEVTEDFGSSSGRNALDNKLYEYGWSGNVRLYVNEKDAEKSLKDAERRRKKNATDKYIKSIENHDGKPILLKDNDCSDLHYGDTVVYIRRVGYNGHPELRKGVIIGESKTTITVFDEAEKQDGKPTGWRGERNKDSEGKHSVQPQSVMLFKLAEVDKKSGYSFVKMT